MVLMWMMMIICLGVSVAQCQVYSIDSFTVTIQTTNSRTVTAIVHYPVVKKSAVLSNSELLLPVTSFPIINFAPGFIFVDTFYDYLWKTIVPLGYVFSVGGTYDYDPISSPIDKSQDQITIRNYLLAQSENNKSSPIYHLINPLKTAAMGHSEGGLGSLISAASSNYTTIIDLTGCFGGTGESWVPYIQNNKNTSALVITGTKDCICSVDTSLLFYNTIVHSPCRYYANIFEGSHCRFANPGPVDSQLCWDLELLKGCALDTKLPAEQLQAQVLSYSIPWLEWQLKDNKNGQSQLDMVLKNNYANKKLFAYASSCLH